MEKLKSTLPNMLFSLTFICISAGAVLAAVNNYTAGPIALAKSKLLEQAIQDVVPSFDNDPIADAYKAVTSDGDSLLIYPAVKDGKQVGVAIDSNTKNGFRDRKSTRLNSSH